MGDANQPLLAEQKQSGNAQANNQVIGEYVTDEKGNITVNGLLKDKYILTETTGPYRLLAAHEKRTKTRCA